VSARQPNVLLLSVDAMRADRTSLHGYSRPTTPTLERLARDAVVCEHAFGLGTFTQTGCVQIFTSTRPLSYGGYDHGARGRPATLFKQFRKAGYRTHCLSTLHWVNRFFGYGDGLDEEYQLFVLNSLPGVSLAMIRSALIGFHAGDVPEETMLSIVEPVLLKLFDDVVEYCAVGELSHPNLEVEFADSALLNAGLDFARVIKVMERHRATFLADRMAYLRRYLIPAPMRTEWMAKWLPRDWYYCRSPAKLLNEIIFRVGNHVLGLVNPRLARLRRTRFKVYPDARSLADKVIAMLSEADDSRPFFIWTHFMDTHRPYVSGAGRQWYRETPHHLRELGYATDIDPASTFDSEPREENISALFDAAVRSTDAEIGRIVDALDRLGLHDDTLVVVTADHGEELGDHCSYGPITFQMYEHSTRVPLILHRPGMGAQRLDGLYTLMDVAPSVAGLTGIAPDPRWEGIPVADPSVGQRDHVLMESFFAGNCLFDYRPLYFAVRTPDWKYMWNEYRDPMDRFSPEGPQLYDIVADPMEKRNLFQPDHPAVFEFNRIIARRMAEIPEIGKERIATAFGEMPSAVPTD
jgi:arylsulfatase A-like enzyme